VNWQLNKIQYPIYNLGPGKRLGIWMQGCSIHCKGCINQSLWDKEKGKVVSVLSVYELINEICRDYDGITLTGGEPFDQYPQLMAFCMLIKRKTDLDILCYSGYDLSELENKFPDKAFHQCIDYLIDGRYDERKLTDNSLKGSANQSIYNLLNGQAVKMEMKNSGKTWSMKCEGEMVYMAGVPRDKEMNRISKELLDSKIIMNLL
jgi:anaerobic ribonucleoside-triphosphate reductase activating protein